MKTEFKIGDKVMIKKDAADIWLNSFNKQSRIKKIRFYEKRKHFDGMTGTIKDMYTTVDDSMLVYEIEFDSGRVWYGFFQQCLELYTIQRDQMLELESIL